MRAANCKVDEVAHITSPLTLQLDMLTSIKLIESLRDARGSSSEPPHELFVEVRWGVPSATAARPAQHVARFIVVDGVDSDVIRHGYVLVRRLPLTHPPAPFSSA
jgi:hypothetical protein